MNTFGEFKTGYILEKQYEILNNNRVTIIHIESKFYKRLCDCKKAYNKLIINDLDPFKCIKIYKPISIGKYDVIQFHVKN